ncbi:MAG: DUF484 family protein [Gammaproteobacteria bacterium]|nr:DUF484 family protein [Gammaproteobacteria bacterium]
MTTPQKSTLSEKELEREIVRYLRDHPDFFEQHLGLLADMILPHNQGNQAISLIERQVSVLRDQKEQYRSKLQTLIQVAEKNEKLSADFNNLTLSLLNAPDLNHVLDIINAHLQVDFNADAVSLRLLNSHHPQLQDHPEIMNWSATTLATFQKVLDGRQPVCGTLKPAQCEALFTDNDDKIKSAALIPLAKTENSNQCYGLLAIGSNDQHRFRADMGTMFLSHLGKVLSYVLKKHLD